jgi:hypothetical protein
VNPPGNQRVPSWVSGEYTKLPVRQLWKFTLFTFKPAETLVEVIIALFIITIGSGAATSLIVNGMQVNAFNKDSLLADSLLHEAKEMIINFRDSNRLKYSSDKEKCWNMDPAKSPSDPCNETKEIKPGQYSLDWNPVSNRFFLTSVSEKLDLKNNQLNSNDNYLLAYYNAGSDSQLLVSSNYIDSFLGSNSNGPSKFYRMVEINYPAGPFPRDSMEFTVTVQWKTSANIHSKRFSETIFNIIE